MGTQRKGSQRSRRAASGRGPETARQGGVVGLCLDVTSAICPVAPGDNHTDAVSPVPRWTVKRPETSGVPRSVPVAFPGREAVSFSLKACLVTVTHD